MYYLATQAYKSKYLTTYDNIKIPSWDSDYKKILSYGYLRKREALKRYREICNGYKETCEKIGGTLTESEIYFRCTFIWEERMWVTWVVKVENIKRKNQR